MPRVERARTWEVLTKTTSQWLLRENWNAQPFAAMENSVGVQKIWLGCLVELSWRLCSALKLGTHIALWALRM